jgi:Zn finger protein HypA/HybF involved in hydrogenase expression
MNRWWCMECQSEVKLDKHGRCGYCDSEAVDPIGQNGPEGMAVTGAQPSLETATSCA